MQGTPEGNGVSMAEVAVYRITVRGALAPELADRLAGMHLESGPGVHGASVTSLTGSLRDQAQLIGVLNALYDMHMPILRVELERVE